MFQPASIRTLLDIRSSSREQEPCTTRSLRSLRRAHTAPEMAVSEELAVAGEPLVSEASMELDAACHSLREQLEEQETREERFSSQGSGDLETLLARANHMLYDLQQRWRQERRDELSRVVKEFEQEFEISSPKFDDIIGCCEAVSSSQSRAQDGSEETKYVDLECDIQLERSAGVADDAEFLEEHASVAEAEADAAIAGAARQLEMTRSFREGLEKRRSAASVTVPGAPETVEYSGIARERETQRLLSLKRDIASLKAKQRISYDRQQGIHPEIQDNSLSFVLDQWAEDLILLSALDERPPGVSPEERPPGVSPNRSLPRRSARISPSNRSMALMAEAKALEWVAGNRPCRRARESEGLASSSPSKKSTALMAAEANALGFAPGGPCRQMRGSGGFASQGTKMSMRMSARQPLLASLVGDGTHGPKAMPSQSAAASALRSQTEHRAGGSAFPKAASNGVPASGSTPRAEAAADAVEKHLDEILASLDEIAWLHDGISRLAWT